MQSFKRKTNALTRCRIPKFCERYKINIGIYDLKGKWILPKSVNQKDVCVYIQKNQYCVLWMKNRKNVSLNGAEEKERNSKKVNNKKKRKNLSQRFRYWFPKHETVDQLENVFLFDLETYDDQNVAEAYAAGLNYVNRLRECWDRDLSPDEIMTETGMVIVFEGCIGKTVMTMPKYVSENYEGEERTCIDRDGIEITSSYGVLLVAHIASGFDVWVILNSLVKETTEFKFVKTARGLISLSFRCGFKLVKTVNVPQSVKFTCTKSHIEGSLEKSGREYGPQPELLERKIENSVNKKGNFTDLWHIRKPYLELVVLWLCD